MPEGDRYDNAIVMSSATHACTARPTHRAVQAFLKQSVSSNTNRG